MTLTSVQINESGHDYTNCSKDSFLYPALGCTTPVDISSSALITIATVLCPIVNSYQYFLHHCNQNHRQLLYNGLFLVMSFSLVSDVMSASGAILVHLLPLQIVFAIVHLASSIVCSLHHIFSVYKQYRNDVPKKLEVSTSLRIKRCLYPFIFLLPTAMVVSKTSFSTQHGELNKRDLVSASHSQISLSLWQLFGYMLGVMSACLSLCHHAVTVWLTYSTAQWGIRTTCILVIGILGDLCYYIGVILHKQSNDAIFLNLPWLLPRIISAGFGAGIIIQQSLAMCRNQTRRTLHGDIDELLGSDVDELSDESEEVIWMPLNTVQRVQPNFNVYPGIQVISEDEFDDESTAATPEQKPFLDETANSAEDPT